MGKDKSTLQICTELGTNVAAFQKRLFCASLIFLSSASRAQGLNNSVSNIGQLIDGVIVVLVFAGVLVGLGFIFVGLKDTASKTTRGNDDITWGSIVSKIGAGGALMALSWLGKQVVETLGGSAGDIGAGL